MIYVYMTRMAKPVKIPDLNKEYPNLPPVKSKYMSRMPFIMSCVGNTSSGKTYTTVGLIKLMKKEGSLNRVFLISPTATSNNLYKSIIGPQDKVYPLDNKVYSYLAEIVQLCEAAANIYRHQLEYLVAKNKFVNGEPINSSDENILEEFNYRNINIVRPSPCLLLDDLQGSILTSLSPKNPLTNLVLKSRHVGEGLGLSIACLVQTSKGFPRALRLNSTHLALWKCQSEKERKLIYDECASVASWYEFSTMWDDATKEKHGFLFVDLWKSKLSIGFEENNI